VIVDRFPRGLVVVGDAGATAFLQSLVSQDLDPVADGGGVHSLLLQPQGKLVADFRALRVRGGGGEADRGEADRGEAEWWLDCEAAFGPLLAGTLGRYRIRVEAEIADRSPGTAMVSVRGEGADDVVRERLGVVPPAEPYAHVAAGELRVVRAAWPGIDGVDVIGPAPALDATAWPAFDPVAYEAARIERGVPRLGADVDDSTIAQEAFLERDAVSFTKGCFLGQELVCRIDTRGHVNRFLRGLRFPATDPLPPRGAEVVSGEKVVGALTSVAPVPGTGDAVALATVRREAEPPARVTIRWDGAEATAGLVELPTA
jgi:tRNA-modifying protein YgfZ